VETSHSTRKLTYEDFEAFPDDLLRHEIIDGAHVVTPAPATRHQRVLQRLLHAFLGFLEAQPLGEVFVAPFDVLLSRHDIVEPDLVYLSHDRAHLLTSKNLQGAPDLVVEILSPSTKQRDERVKRALYEREGVAEYWLVDPDLDSVTVHRRGPAGFDPPETLTKTAGHVLTTPLLPGFVVPLTRILA
jgi:Uma2 family endonuclease